MGTRSSKVAENPSFMYRQPMTMSSKPWADVKPMVYEVAAALLNDVGEKLHAHESIELDVPRRALGEPARRLQALQANSFYGREVEVHQLILPNKEGLFPWQVGYDHQYMDPR
jgi:hypothetical protein